MRSSGRAAPNPGPRPNRASPHPVSEVEALLHLITYQGGYLWARPPALIVTCTTLLADVEEGGETTLPLAQAIDEAAQQLEAPSACAARMGLAVRPRKGDALMFFDMDIQVRD